VTLVGLVPRADGYQCALLTGEAMPTEMVFPGNPVRVRVEEPTDRIIRWISRRGIGHHWMIGYGDVADEIRTWADICGPSLLLLDGDEGLNA